MHRCSVFWGFILATTIFCNTTAIAARHRPTLYALHLGWSGDQMTSAAGLYTGASNIVTSSLNGIAFGLERRHPLNANLWLQTELNYVARGLYVSLVQSGQSLTETVNMNYLEVPLLLRAETEVGGFFPFLLGGISVSAPISQSALATNVTTGATSTATSSTGGLDFGAYVGGGLAFPVGEGIRAGVEGRYYFGFRDLSGTGIGVRHRDLLLMGAVSYDFGAAPPPAVEKEKPTETPKAPEEEEQEPAPKPEKTHASLKPKWIATEPQREISSVRQVAQKTDEPPNYYFGIGASGRYFFYSEVLTSPLKSQESGILPGGSLYLEQYLDTRRWKLTEKIEVAGGILTYNGTTQPPNPVAVSSNDGHSLWIAEVDGGIRAFTFSPSDNPYAGYFYTGLHGRVWVRGLADPYEVYKLLTVPLGLRLEPVNRQQFSVGLDASARLMFLGNVSVTYTSAMGDQNVIPQPQNLPVYAALGFRVEVPIWVFAEDWGNVTVCPWYEYSAITQGPQIPLLTPSGTQMTESSQAVGANEPSSYTNQAGLNLSVEFKW